ncbi:MerR family transcriptional regulator [Paracoccus sediminis]|uniref:MerR HTH family regulatory protein n=1 Tax=Paracoccus sediminis TaxID=1214787 RepID=A0A238X5X4_9RHOB|nr:MerR family transcriptional regulator [Paracoccus sediminis]TBN49031.1 MerR family transcriptional regulator [Paracoccus sediminis]SNR54090.1 MerR HTH family regulatory protein [Paracoccus sediminis]
MTKGADAFRSIGEVARLLGVAPHVLRYWETQFPLLKPMKRPDGRRYYRPDDVRLAAGLCIVLRDEGLTIRGAKKLLARDRGASVRERGLLRLADLAEPVDPAPDLDLDGADDDLDAGPEPAQEPRSRHRRRRAVGMSPGVSLNGRSQERPISWLAEVMALNARLRGLRPSDAAAPHHRASLSRLRDALARIC